MRTYSTPQSALELEITKLAIIECAAAAILYMCIGIYLGTFKYLAAAIVIAPLMLYRTQFSDEWGHSCLEKIAEIIEKVIGKVE